MKSKVKGFQHSTGTWYYIARPYTNEGQWGVKTSKAIYKTKASAYQAGRRWLKNNNYI